jgi:D-serine deaminase-like pyridoxal phosphate-dependent protein
MMNSTASICKPTLIIHKPRAIRNIRFIAEKTVRQNIIFRPHFKTHQSSEIGTWFRNFGVDKISVSSMDMAAQFVDAGWKDITLAFPFNRRETAAYNLLREKSKINLVLEDAGTATFLAENSPYETDIYLKIDCGYGRTGLDAGNHKAVQELARHIGQLPRLHLRGLLAHFGNNYHAAGKREVTKNYREGVNKLNTLRNSLKSEFPALMISVGDTPSASLVDDFGAVDELRPGNFVFYDWMQYEIGSCAADQIAVVMACPVVAVHPGRNEVVIHGGAVHFSKERGRTHYGPVYDLQKGFNTEPIENVYLKALSQEHGIVQGSQEWIAGIRPGDLIGIIPIHSCLTANLMRHTAVEIWER